MKKRLLSLAVCLLATTIFSGCSKEKSAAPPSPVEKPAPLSKEVTVKGEQAIEKGVTFLLNKQLPDGTWLRDPAVTALVCTALHESNSKTQAKQIANAIEKGRLVILNKVQNDGSFMGSEPNYINYTTATCLYALAIINNPTDTEIMRKARHFLIDLQLDEDNVNNPTDKSDPFHGGIGYGSGGPTRPDLSNTQLALEALYVTEHLDTEAGGGTPEDAAKAKLAWKNAIGFLKNVQNIPDGADNSWTVPEEADLETDGGFIYRPDQSKASDKNNEETLRSYGSMTYAGLKSMLYAKLNKDDYRVKAATEWARRNYTLDENPGMGPEGHFYYLMTFAKAHAALGQDTVTTLDNKKHNWREDVITKLADAQKEDGHWVNEANGRWMEGMSELVTSYSLIALELAMKE